MKRIFAVLAIVFLLTASMASYAEYCIFSPKACPIMAQAISKCAHETQSCEAGGGCCGARHEACQPSKSCESASCSEEIQDCAMNVEKCAQEPDCLPKICRLRPPLLADGPNRVRGHVPEIAHLFTAIAIPFDIEAASFSRLPQSPPPWGIHPSIAMTVLRI